MKPLAWLALWLGVASAWLPQPALAWRLGGLALAAHATWAFAGIHGWSHDAAREATARQVEAVTGSRLGSGIWVNYAFVIAWSWIAWAWPRMNRQIQRAWWACFLFMGFNGAVVFVHGPARWMGAAWTMAAIAAFATSWKDRKQNAPQNQG